MRALPREQSGEIEATRMFDEVIEILTSWVEPP